MTHILDKGLRKYGFEVTCYNDPEKALFDFKRGCFDLVILDYKMKIMNGFSLYQAMTKIDHNVKYCFLSASEYEVKKGDTHKPDLLPEYFIRKPFKISDLVNKINRI